MSINRLCTFLCTFPIVPPISIYLQTRLEFPIGEIDWVGDVIKKFTKDDPEYAAKLKAIPGHQIKEKMQAFLKSVNVREDVLFYETPNIGICTARGTNSFTQGVAEIDITPRFYETDPEACRFSIKHEISHIKHNDMLTMPGVAAVCQCVASVFGLIYLAFVPAVALTYAVSLISSSLHSTWRETKADDFAIENSSDEELKGGRRVLMAMQKANLQMRQTFWTRLVCSDSGEMRLDIIHPSLTSRIQKIEKALEARGAAINAEEEQKKIDEKLVSFIMSMISNLGVKTFKNCC